MGRIENMRMKLLFRTLLMIEALLIIVQIAIHRDPWVGMMCFWGIVAVENIFDIIDEVRNGGNDKGGNDRGGNGRAGSV